MDDMTPRVSVLIATRNRPDDLAPCLRTMLRQAHPSYEVVVVDQTPKADGSAVAEFAGDSRLHYLPSPTVGKSAALNELLAAARGEILAFTDDDTEAPADWLCQIERSFEEHPDAGIVFGQVFAGPDADGQPDAYVPSFLIAELRYLKAGEISGMGANMGMRRWVAEKVGRFDAMMGPGTPMPASEEGDYIYRAQQAGARVLHDPQVTLVHRAWRSGGEWTRVLHSYGLGDAAFAMKHLRCRDWRMLGRIGWHLGYYAARLCYRVLCRRAHQEEHYLRGYCRGMVLSRRYRVDPRTRLYVEPAAR